MDSNYKKHAFVCLFCFFISILQGQTLENIYNDSLEDIENKFLRFNETVKIKLSKSYLIQAKEENNTIKIANGYYLNSLTYSHTKKAVKYADSIIQIGNRLKNTSLLSKGHLQKGIQLYYLTQYNQALDNYIIAKKHFESTNNKFGLVIVKHYVGLLKNVNSSVEEALRTFKDNYNYIKKNSLDTIYQNQYLKSLYALADSYTRNEIPDSAKVYYLKGIKATQHKNNIFYRHFLSGYGIHSYLTNNYKTAIDTLKKASQFLKKHKINLSVAYLYIYESYRDMGKSEEGLKYLFKVDSLYQKDSSVIYYARDTYELLKNYYKKVKKPEKQIKYLTKLITIDSLLEIKYEELDNDIIKKYEIPSLVSEKEALILSLKEKDSFQAKSIWILIIFGVLLILVLTYFAIKNRKYKKRFDELMIPTLKKEKLINKKQNITELSNKNNTPKEVIEFVLNKLVHFENSNKFIKKKYTLHSLAKELKTNSSYLSSIINSTKETNFSNYLNNLRIDYAVNKLKENKSFRSYTIKAIAEEVGFNTAQSFTNAFYKKTGLYPSYFIKKINQ